jgi:hypothetical protein
MPVHQNFQELLTRIKVILLSGDFRSFWKEFLGKYALDT